MSSVTTVITQPVQTLWEPNVITYLLRISSQESVAEEYKGNEEEFKTIPYLLKIRPANQVQEVDEVKSSAPEPTVDGLVESLVGELSTSPHISEVMQLSVKFWWKEWFLPNKDGGLQVQADVLAMLVIKFLNPLMKSNKVRGLALWKHREGVHRILKLMLPASIEPQDFVKKTEQRYRTFRVEKVKEQMLSQSYQNETLSVDKANEINQECVDGVTAVGNELQTQIEKRQQSAQHLNGQLDGQKERLDKIREEFVVQAGRANNLRVQMEQHNGDLKNLAAKCKQELQK